MYDKNVYAGQNYYEPQRASDSHALPDLEIFYVSSQDIKFQDSVMSEDMRLYSEEGYYYWTCFPGCLPDSDPTGPFPTSTHALLDARGYNPDSGWIDSGDTLTLYEGFSAFYLVHNPTNKEVCIGDGVGMFSTEEGDSIPSSSPDWWNAARQMLEDIDTLLDAYFPEVE